MVDGATQSRTFTYQEVGLLITCQWAYIVRPYVICLDRFKKEKIYGKGKHNAESFDTEGLTF